MKNITISRKAKDFKGVCVMCKHPLNEEDNQLCMRCEEIRYDCERDACNEDMDKMDYLE